jgi:hypothetical protein
MKILSIALVSMANESATEPIILDKVMLPVWDTSKMKSKVPLKSERRVKVTHSIASYLLTTFF